MSYRQLAELGSTVAGGLVITGAVLIVAAQLVRERPQVQDLTAPVPVSLVSLPRERPALRPEPLREPEPPRQPPRVDFTPELPLPSLTSPVLPSPAVHLDPALFGGLPAIHPWVFEASELDQPPRAVVQTKPVYPFKAQQRGIEGQVGIRFLVRRDGSIGEIVIDHANPPGVFEDAVREAVSHWRFEPGRLAGEPVDTWVTLPISFDMNAGQQ